MPLNNRVWSAGRILVIAACLVATYLIFAVTAMRVALRVREVPVPDLRNQTVAEATAQLQDAGLALSVDESGRLDPKIPAGRIALQDPAPGAVTRRQRSIRVWVSRGPRNTVVPSLTGESERAAQLRLEQDGLAANTVIVFFGDNGQAHVRGKQFCYESGLLVPMIVRWPKNFPEPKNFQAGTVNTNLLEAIDLAPTMLEIAAAKVPAQMQGAPFLGDHVGAPKRYVFGARDRCDETVFRFRTVRDAQYRYIRNFTPEHPFLQANEYKEKQYPVWNLLKELNASGKLTPEQAVLCAPTMPAEELYDLESDPDEVRNLASSLEDAKVLKRLRGVLEKWIRDSGDQGRELEPADLAARKGMTNAQTNPQSGYALGETNLQPKMMTVPATRK